MVVSVVFNRKFDSKEYHYLMDDNNVKMLDEVLVPVGNFGHIEVATVVAMWDKDVHFKHSDINPLSMKRVIALADNDKLIEMMLKELDEVHKKYNKLLSKVD